MMQCACLHSETLDGKEDYGQLIDDRIDLNKTLA